MQKHQMSFPQAEYAKKKKTTRREVFLEKMEHVVPWSRLVEVIEPHSNASPLGSTLLRVPWRRSLLMGANRYTSNG